MLKNVQKSLKYSKSSEENIPDGVSLEIPTDKELANEILNGPITEKKWWIAYVMKNNKASGPDCILNEYLKSTKDILGKYG